LDILARPSLRIITITFFLYCCHIGLNHQKQAWFFLREATTLYMCGPVEVDSELEGGTSVISNRLFWLLLISERYAAIWPLLLLRRHPTNTDFQCSCTSTTSADNTSDYT
jgi:hypothetical protein